MLELIESLLDEPAAAPGEYGLVRVRAAMATTFEVAIPQGSHPNAVAAAEDALELIDELEEQMTVFRDTSEVSQINAAASRQPVPVEVRLFELFQRCADWTRETDGAFDIAAGALTKAWGFYRRDGRVPSPRGSTAMAATGMKHVILASRERKRPESGTVKFRVPGLEFNLGAVGKGYALDRAANCCEPAGAFARPCCTAVPAAFTPLAIRPATRRWPIGLRHPDDPSRSLGTVRFRDRGLGTSAATFQFFEYNGRKLGHLLDPRTGWPAEGTSSASVVAPTAAEADAMSTALFVLGRAAGRFARTRPHLGGVLLIADPLPVGGEGGLSRETGRTG